MDQASIDKAQVSDAESQFQEFSDALEEDLWRALKDFDKDREDPFLIRTAVRTFGAYVEGITSYIQERVLERQTKKPFLDPYEIGCMEDSQARLDKSGRLVVIESYSPFLNKYFFILRMLVKSFGYYGEMPILRAGRGYQDFMDLKRLRDAYMHPSSSDDLIVPKEFHEKVIRAYFWHKMQSEFGYLTPTLAVEKLADSSIEIAANAEASDELRMMDGYRHFKNLGVKAKGIIANPPAEPFIFRAYTYCQASGTTKEEFFSAISSIYPDAETRHKKAIQEAEMSQAEIRGIWTE